ncbi:MAG TPA: sugar phosphate nucleotidyltransferase, partial [Candidatus Cloacimonas sp.]|nr:sugar phosphate nucleotidyltransferase [Candidatus Cloacimonas sp.]
MQAVIIAAGIGSRLWQTTKQVPKTLLPYQNGTILSTIIEHLKEAG